MAGNKLEGDTRSGRPIEAYKSLTQWHFIKYMKARRKRDEDCRENLNLVK